MSAQPSQKPFLIEINKIRFLAIFIMVNTIFTSFQDVPPALAFHNLDKKQSNIAKKDEIPESTAVYGGTLVWGTTNPPTIINPLLTTTSVSASLMRLIFDYVVKVDGHGQIIPDLAQEWHISKDGREYTFYLNQGVKFHDGVECTADDVIFTYQQQINPVNKSPARATFDLIEEVVGIDKYTFKIILSEPFPQLLYKLYEIEIMPKHIWEHEKLDQSAFNYKPVGTGPFKLQDWNRETNEIKLVANKDYFEGRPYLDGITVKVFKDMPQLWSAFMRQEVDLVKFIPREDYLLIKDDPAFRAYEFPVDIYYAIIYNLNDPLLFDKDIRRAIAYGINVDLIIDSVFSGAGVKSTGPFYPQLNKQFQTLAYDPVKAKMELGFRGWRDIDGDGIIEKAGKKLIINLLVDAKKEVDKKIALIVRQQLSEIGIQVKLKLYDGEKEINEDMTKFSHSQAWLRFLSGQKPSGYESMRDWYSQSTEAGKIWQYKNQQVDQLFELARMTNDQPQHKKIYKQINSLVYDDQPACFLFFPVVYHGVSAKFKNTDEYFSLEMPTYTIKNWYTQQ